jgi:hypothetical protein
MSTTEGKEKATVAEKQEVDTFGMMTGEKGWQMITSVYELEEKLIFQTVNPSKIAIINRLHTKLVPFLSQYLKDKDTSSKDDLLSISVSNMEETISLYLLDIWDYRRGSIFFFLQHCTRTDKVRVVAYANRKWAHSGSWGTSPFSDISGVEIEKDLRKKKWESKHLAFIPHYLRQRLFQDQVTYFV